ncbi:spore maturation protein [Paramaledivibacter caminithermalis]|jgi:spore maturation protein B|uniref:Spore maturation protein B n=1 Tax=Paramaledivibacter caminithermalis (strain DSM 15212 / CIP 107654 / DViRD3) TaxID=1121301 RepID=A0A1M6QA70_PARC5|nr:nucleoside recognition domain-containing protein [Paramaledivibacter caminithermalis]SHK16983.1 spore maturation protein B [Paramaledivibacter caminithermalis DSM 15212]
MYKILNIVSITAIPFMITIILVHGYIKGVKLYDTFVEGASDGFKTAIKIMPYLIAIFLAIGIFKESGALDVFSRILTIPGRLMGLPKEIIPLIVIKPISGSGSLAMVKDLVYTYGPDSLIGRIASTMMGSSETIFYTMAIYFGAIGIKKSRHTLSCALIAHIAGVIASAVACRIIFT